MKLLPCPRYTWGTCPDCGKRFDRSWSAHSGSPSYGRYAGSTYCRPCAYRRSVVAKRKRVDGACKCDGCGTMFRPTFSAFYAHKYGQNGNAWYCTPTCLRDSTRLYIDEREAVREDKRRYRAARRARGLTASGKPYASEATRLAALKKVVLPQGGTYVRQA